MHGSVPHFLIAAIVFGYFVIAAQFFVAARGTQDSKGRQALFLLIGIFILCSFAGYVPHLLSLPFAFEVGIHTSLVLATWWFIFTNQAAHIIKALR